MRSAYETPIKAAGELHIGREGVDGQTLPVMRRYVRAALEDNRVRRAAEMIVHAAGARGGDRRQEAAALFAWTRAHVRYARDPSHVELVHEPQILLYRIDRYGWAAGDCDDQACLIAALGHSIALPVAWVLAGSDERDLQHIYPAMALDETVADREDLLALDTASPRPVFGRHAPAPHLEVVPALEDF